MGNLRENVKRWSKSVWADYLVILAGALVYSYGIYGFTAANDVAPGGVTGISTMVHYLTGWLPIGVGIYVINIPLLIAGFALISRRFFLKTVFVLTASTLLIDFLFPLFMPVYHGDKLMASAFGGVLMGVGTGILYLRGGTTGGTDIAARLFMRKFPYMKFGTVMFAIEVVVIAAAGIVYGSMEASLYSLIASFAYSAIVDRILYGADKGKLVYIISCKNGEIARVILDRMERGATMLDAHGAFSGEARSVLLCAIRNQEYFRLKRMVQEIDPAAFLIVAESSEVLGLGFKPIVEENKS